LSKLEIIGISGKAGSGKDFVGRAILRPAGYHQWAFAWPMKTLAVGRGFSYEDVFVTKPPAARQMLQQLGTEEGWMIYGKNYWLDQAGAWLRTMQENLGISRFYFSDVRYEHEAKWIRDFGGKLVRLEHGDRAYPLAGTTQADHSSETALDSWIDWDVVITNGKGTTLVDLREQLDTVVPYAPLIREFINEVVPLDESQEARLARSGFTPISRDQKGVLGRWRQGPTDG